MNPLRVIRDQSNGLVIGLGNPSYVNNYHFAGAGTATVNWPAGASVAHISGTVDFYANAGGAAAVPGADITDGTASRYNPAFIERGEDGTFGLAVSAAGEICVEFFA